MARPKFTRATWAVSPQAKYNTCEIPKLDVVGNVSLMATAIRPYLTFKTGFTFYLATCGTDDPAFDMSGLTWRDLLIGGPE